MVWLALGAAALLLPLPLAARRLSVGAYCDRSSRRTTSAMADCTLGGASSLKEVGAPGSIQKVVASAALKAAVFAGSVGARERDEGAGEGLPRPTPCMLLPSPGRSGEGVGVGGVQPMDTSCTVEGGAEASAARASLIPGPRVVY